MISTTQYNCTNELHGVERGTASVDGDAVVAHRHGRVVRIDNTCGRSGENVLGPAEETYRWSVATVDGRETLTLTSADGTAQTFRRRE